MGVPFFSYCVSASVMTSLRLVKNRLSNIFTACLIALRNTVVRWWLACVSVYCCARTRLCARRSSAAVYLYNIIVIPRTRPADTSSPVGFVYRRVCGSSSSHCQRIMKNGFSQVRHTPAEQ